MLNKNQGPEKGSIANRSLLLPYGLPYFAYVGIATLGHERLSPETGYLLKLIVVPLLLFWAWKWYVPFRGPKRISGSIVYGIVFGLAGLFVWCLLMAPFIDSSAEAWSGSAFILRLLAASLIVPVFEELFIRGYILRVAYQWDKHRKTRGAMGAVSETLDHDTIDRVEPGAWTIAAVALSTLAFTVGHLLIEWPAAIAYSILISTLWIIRKDLLSCMVAHGTTNFFLALYVYISGQWGFW